MYVYIYIYIYIYIYNIYLYHYIVYIVCSYTARKHKVIHNAIIRLLLQLMSVTVVTDVNLECVEQ